MGNIKLGVSLIIQVNDTYTFRPVTSGNIKIYTDMGRQAISKGNGIFVFTNLSAGKYRMFIESDIFQDSYGEFEIIENNIETVHLWLIPDYKYDLLNNSAIVRGKSLMNNNERYIAYKPYNDFLVLADAYKANDKFIKILHNQNLSYQGMELIINDNQKIKMGEMTVRNNFCEYLLYEPLEIDIDKSNSSIEVCFSLPDSEIYFPVREIPKEGLLVRFVNGKRMEKLVLQRNKETIINILEDKSI